MLHSPWLRPWTESSRGIVDGCLPVILPHRVYASYGLGITCRPCAQPVEQHHTEYDLTDRESGWSALLHLTCQAIRQPAWPA